MRLPERLLIAHFWHPPHLIPLVEVVPGSATLPHLAREVSDFCAACALEAVVLNRAAPGFVGNRLQFALLREALHIVHSGIASRRWWTVMRASLGRRYAMVGPLEAADMTGRRRSGYLPAPAAGAGQRHGDDVAGGGESGARRHRRPQRARLLPLGRGPAPAHPVAPGTPAALRPETLVSRSVPYNNNESETS